MLYLLEMNGSLDEKRRVPGSVEEKYCGMLGRRNVERYDLTVELIPLE